MRRYINSILMISCFAVFSGEAYSVVQPMFKEIKTTNSLVSQKTHRKLKRIQVLLEQENYQGALENLSALEKRVTNKVAALGKVKQYQGFVHAQKGNYPQAIDSFKSAVQTGGLPKSTAIQSMEILGQLYMATENYNDSLRVFRSIELQVKSLSPQTYSHMAIAFAQTKNKSEALRYINKAIESAQKPQKTWLELQVALNIESKKYNEGLTGLMVLIDQFPGEKKYWSQLTSVSLLATDENKALAALKLADKKNFLTKEKEILSLCQLQLSVGEPYYGAKRLEHALEKGQVERTKKNYQFLAQSWYAAKNIDQAIVAYGYASRYDKKGSLDLVRAQLLMEGERWKDAFEALSGVLQKKSSASDIERANLLMGIVSVQMDRIDLAQKHFKIVQSSEEFGKQATTWLASIGKMDSK